MLARRQYEMAPELNTIYGQQAIATAFNTDTDNITSALLLLFFKCGPFRMLNVCVNTP